MVLSGHYRYSCWLVCVVGEYVTLYQQQRSVLRQRANEREGYIYQLARERIDLQAKLGELQTLVVTLLGERSMLHSYHTASTASTSSTPTASPSVPTPTKRRRRTKHGHSHDTGADGMSSLSLSLTLWILEAIIHVIPTFQPNISLLAAFSE